MKIVKRIGLGLLSLFVVFVLYRFLAVYEFRSGECAPREAREFDSTYPKRLVVMTYNIEGHASLFDDEHLREVAAVINAARPDVVGLNEAHRGTWQVRGQDQVAELRRLTGMNGVFGRSYALDGEFGNVVLTRGAIAGVDHHRLPGTGEPRSLLETTIQVNGGIVSFYATHLTAWGSLNRKTRIRQLQCVAEHVKASRNPFIVTGDLNASPDSPEMQEFARESFLQMPAGVTDTHKVTKRQLDYIFFDRGWSVRNVRVIDAGPSDHRAVVVELTHP